MTNVAIVEDSRQTRETLERLINLRPDYHCVCVCETAEEALKVVPRHQPHIVLMDVQLPGMPGIQCASRLRELLPDTRIIMLTVYEDPDRIFSAMRAGASGYLLKRSTPDQLFNAIREVQEGGAPMSAPIAVKVFSYFRTQETDSANTEKLSAREYEILELIVHGFPNKEIAARLAVSNETVRWHLNHIYRKLQVHSRTEAALKFRPHK
ncbi:MAG TPA: response regulator transcription factor [Verrucomicrobiae bacterium]|jgi:DNA-binding NarL/FixJ family response regulator|nr:response regulator transcription factor [Verrucomicrobiae bacterium]